MKKLLLIFFISLAFSFSIKAQGELPTLKYLATDLTNTLSADDILTLNKILSAFEDSTSNQLVFLMIPTLNDYPIEEYANQVAQKNKIGTKKNDNGILLLVVKNDHKIRIEVGYGLEGALPDATCNSIIRNEILPFFKEDNYSAGVLAGVGAITKATIGEYKNDAPKSRKRGKSIGGWIIPFLIIIFSFLFRGRSSRGIYLGTGMALGGFGRSSGFGGFGGGSSGGFGGFSGGGGSFGGGGASGSW